MRICVVGGGKVGFYLSKTLLEHGHTPVIIERDEALCTKIANSLDISVIHGDGSQVEILQAARCEECHAIACVSGRDEVNLIAAQLAKNVFNVQKVVARVNNPNNTEVLKKLGVDVALSSTNNIAHIIEREVETDAVRHLLSLYDGSFSLVEVLVPENFRYHMHTLAEIKIPDDLVIVSILREHTFIVPRGSTQIFSGDKATIIANDDSLHHLIDTWKLIAK